MKIDPLSQFSANYEYCLKSNHAKFSALFLSVLLLNIYNAVHVCQICCNTSISFVFFLRILFI